MASSKAVQRVVANIESVCDGHIANATSKSNAGLAKKWANVKADFITAAGVFADYSVSPKTAIPSAIYAAQKTAKMLRSVATGVNMVDRYTQAVFANGRKTGTISNKLQNASLSKHIEGEFGSDLDVRLAAHTTTASTQASSTRKALEGLGLCAISDRVMNLTLDNPLGTRLMEVVDGIVAPVSEEPEEATSPSGWRAPEGGTIEEAAAAEVAAATEGTFS